jgi:hypothetical protein
MIKTVEKKYEALGFIEALIAIILVGVSSLVLLKITIDTLNNAIQNETIDNMTQYAIEGAEMIQDIANRHKIEQEKLENPETYFPDKEDWGYCFVVKKEDGEASFLMDSDDNFIKFEKENRDEYRSQKSEEDRDPDYIEHGVDFLFRVICLDPYEGPEEEKPKFVIARVVVGQRYYDEDFLEGRLHGKFVRDYEYLKIVNL